MEKHIFKFGENSLAMIIPKRWADKHGVKPSSLVQLDESEDGALTITTGKPPAREAEKSITPNMSPLLVGRWVGLHYMYGTSRLRLRSASGLTQPQLDGIETKIRDECPGFEVTSESHNEVVIEDFTNIKEIDLEKILSRLRSLIEQEFREITGDNPKTVKKIEKIVNRFYMLGIRYVNITQAKDALKYSRILQLIELISDNLNAIADAHTIKDKSIFEDLGRAFRMAFDGAGGDQKHLDQVAELRASVVKKIKRSKAGELHGYLLEDIANGIANISEFGLTAEKKAGEFTIPIPKENMD
jgi:phosphate uptake regulator